VPFTIRTDYEFDWDATIEQPEEGRHVRRTIRVRFRVLPEDEERQIVESGVPGVDRPLLQRVWVGWREGDVLDADGGPVAFSEEVRDRMLALPYVRLGLVAAYYDAVAGRAVKN